MRHNYLAAIGLTAALAVPAAAQWPTFPNQPQPPNQQQWPQQQQFPQQPFPNQQWPGQQAQQESPLFPVHQFLNQATGGHMYAINEQEVANLQSMPGMQYQGVAFQTIKIQNPSVPMRLLQRFILPNQARFMSTSRREGRQVGAMLEGPMGWIASQPAQGFVPLYGYENAQARQYFYTTDPNPTLPTQAGYGRGGIIGYVLPAR